MAAGLGFKTFTTGEVLTAADVNGYLMQGVLVFASEAARNAAITSPQEGQFAYTKDNNSLWYYTGSAWAASGATGDIEGVTAGTGISGGGTSGTVTITNSMATEIDAKGDLIVGTGADTFARLAVGANDTVLVAASGEATGMKWAAPAGGGKVLQVLQDTLQTNFTTTSTSYVDTGLSVTITPSSNTSKIMIIASGLAAADRSGTTASQIAEYRLVGPAVVQRMAVGYNNMASATNTELFGTVNFSYLDSPATTSATEYKIQAKTDNASTTVKIAANATQIASIVVMEIGA